LITISKSKPKHHKESKTEHKAADAANLENMHSHKHEQIAERKVKINTKYVLIALILILIAVAGYFLYSLYFAKEPAKSGDTVAVWYKGYLDTGKVFDTNIEEVGLKQGMERKTYEPFKFTIGKKQVIPGFENGIIGMKPGQKKTLTIPPAEAYGAYNADLVKSIPNTKEMDVDKYYPVQLSLLNMTVEKGQTIEIPNSIWLYDVVNMTDDIVTVTPHIKVGDIVNASNNTVSIEVISINKNNISLVQRLMFKPGQYVQTGLFQKALVKEVGANFVTLDYNGELAGKTLYFDIELISIDE
jgi:peptidylprolyl isomerase